MSYKPTDARLRANSPNTPSQPTPIFAPEKRLIDDRGSRANVFDTQPWVEGANFTLDGNEGCGWITLRF